MPEDVQRRGANQQALMGMIPTGVDDVLPLGAAALAPAMRAGRGLLDEVADTTADTAKAGGGILDLVRSEPKQAVSGTWGDATRPGVLFEGAEPGQFTPGQMGRFGEHYGAHNIGPADEEAWYSSLKPFTGKSGTEYQVPGGLESTDPFTYWDDLYMKAQGINPNDLTPEQHLAIHNRTVGGKQAPPEGFSDEQINNQLQMALLSPNNPLTPNEFAVASTMAKHGGDSTDLKSIASGTPGYSYAEHPMYGETDALHQEGGRRELSNALLQRLGTQGAEKGGTGISGNQDYTTLTGLGQMMLEKPEFFRFKGAGEGSDDAGEQWLNFVDRLQTQVPGLAGKTGSFGAVWQDPAKAATSAMDRHMLSKFRDKVFETPEEAGDWSRKLIDKWNAQAPDNPVKTVDELRAAPGGTNFFTDQMFSYVNKPASGKMRATERKGKNFVGPVNKPVSERVPEHLRPANADYVKEPTEFQSLGPAYRRGIDANVESMNQAGATGVFSDQWRVWDKIRNRFEPHEIMQPGLADVPRMSQQQQADALKQHGLLGYLNYSKDAEGNLQPVRPSLFKDDEVLTPARERMKQMLKGVDPSKLAYFSALLGIPLAGYASGRGEPDRGGGA